MKIPATRASRQTILVAVLCIPAGAGLLLAGQQKLDRDEVLRQVQVDVKSHRLDDALRIVAQLASQNPHDYEARNWVARLQSWKGHYTQAESLYRGVLADHPGDVEAEIGLADVLGWQQHYSNAVEILKSLETRDPNNLEVLSRLGRLYFWQHDKPDARHYFNRVLQIDPANKEAHNILDDMEGETPFHLETGYLFEGYNFTSNTNGTATQLVYKDYDRKTLLVGFLFQNKFGQNDSLFTLGGTYRALKQTYLRGELTVAPKSQTVVPNLDYTGEVMQGLPHGIAVGGAFRDLQFSLANVRIPMAQMDWDVTPKVHYSFRYTPAETHFTGIPGYVWNQGGWTKLTWDINRYFSPYAMVAMGAESFAITVSVEQLGIFQAHTYGGGAELRFSARQGVHVGYFYQGRSLGLTENWFGLSYYRNF
jgi:tetratricopeptide (TPR) repeat protein